MNLKDISNSSRTVLKWLSSTAGKGKVHIVFLLLVQSVLGICGVSYALFLRRIINAAVDGQREEFFSSVAALTGMIVFQLLLSAFNRFLMEYTASTLENRFKERLFNVLLTRDYGSVTRIHSGEWMNRLTSDTKITADGMTQILPGTAGMAVRMAGAVTGILILEPAFLWILIPGGILIMGFTYGFRRILKRMHKRIQEADGRLRVCLSERLSGMMVIRIFGQEKSAAACSSDLMCEHKSARMQRNHFANLCNTGFSAALNGLYILGAFFCGYGILNGAMSYGDFTAMLQLIGQIQNPFANITSYLPRYYAMLASAERLMEAESFPLDHTEEPVTESEVKRFYQEEFSGLEMKDISFTYPAPAEEERSQNKSMPVVIRNLNLKILKGETVAFAGPSGCGKSTVLKLFMCLYPTDSGDRSILTHKGEIPLTSCWRTLFSYVPQGNYLMSGTIREIVTFHAPDHTDQEERFRHALRIACADGFVSSLEKGADTLLGERGAGLSEGQMQRLAIARAVFSDHPILLLDEATSSLDPATEKQLLKNLRTMTDKTVIIVTHRTAALDFADRCIHFKEQGRIVHE